MNNLAIFSRLIRSQLLLHNRVSLPGMGSFIAEDQPSTFLDDGRLISAPGRAIKFSVKESWNDEFLERAYAAELEDAMLELEDDGFSDTSKLFFEQAKREVAQFVSFVKDQLQSSGAFHFPGLGTMKMEGKHQEITFLKSTDSDLSPEDFGLPPISIKPLPSPSRLIEPQPQVQVRKPEPKTKISKPTKISNPQKRTPKWRYVLLGVLLVIIVALLLVYVFREELRPWLEQLLYTPEERQWLHMM